jgi:hypothetical protein
MRIVFGGLLLAMGVLAPQQSSSGYHSLYGQSDMDRFMVRPGVSLTVEYGQDQVACQMVVEGTRPLVSSARKADALLATNEVSQIIDDLVPPNTRGTKLRTLGSWQSGQAFSSGEEYENVEISRVTIDCTKFPAACVARTYVKLKRKECDAVNKDSSEPAPHRIVDVLTSVR